MVKLVPILKGYLRSANSSNAFCKISSGNALSGLSIRPSSCIRFITKPVLQLINKKSNKSTFRKCQGIKAVVNWYANLKSRHFLARYFLAQTIFGSFFSLIQQNAYRGNTDSKTHHILPRPIIT